MIFKDRRDAGRQLGEKLLKDKLIRKSTDNCIVFSLVRGGAPVGFEIAAALNCSHLPLIVKKISAPDQEELAIGAICQSKVVLNNNLISQLNLTEKKIKKQIRIARKQEKNYRKKFLTRRIRLSGKIAILVDDGIATGASIQTACQALRLKKVKKIILAVPVAPTDFNPIKITDKAFILYKDPVFCAVSQYYSHFNQLTDEETKTFFSPGK